MRGNRTSGAQLFTAEGNTVGSQGSGASEEKGKTPRCDRYAVKIIAQPKKTFFLIKEEIKD